MLTRELAHYVLSYATISPGPLKELRVIIDDIFKTPGTEKNTPWTYIILKLKHNSLVVPYCSTSKGSQISHNSRHNIV
jgi:hypothetical protein